MRPYVLAAATVALAAPSVPAVAADLQLSIELPRLNVAGYRRPYVAAWIERPDNTTVQTVAVWYNVEKANGVGQDWLKDIRTWWRRGGRDLRMPADGVSSATRAPGRHAVTIPAARLRSLPPGRYVLMVEAAREQGGREAVRIPFTWGQPGTAAARGSAELGAVSLTVTR